MYDRVFLCQKLYFWVETCFRIVFFTIIIEGGTPYMATGNNI